MAEGEDGEREVLTSLPRSRPVRRSAKRDAPARSKQAAKPAANAARKAPAKPRRTAGAKATAKPRSAGAKATPKPRKGGAKTQPSVPPERKVPPAGYAAPASAEGDSPPGATQILVTAIQAATELAQIGFSVGRQALQSAIERLPKP